MAATICDYDLCIIGGGINGAGIARDAAGRGLRVLLIERADLGGATSSASTKLVHGGLRYLEYGQFRLVREALREREILLRIAPHITRPLSFVLPHDPAMRPAWMIRAGLFLYDHLAGRGGLAPSRALDLSMDALGRPLSPLYGAGFLYSDGWVDDARLVVLNAVDAAEHRATIRTRTACTELTPLKDSAGWRVTSGAKAGHDTITARTIVNATGPWVRDFLDQTCLTGPDLPRIRLVKGSHIVVPRLYDGAQAYILQQPDRRIVFAIPYLGEFTLVGTTEEAYAGDPALARISPEETRYLCNAIARAFCVDMPLDKIVWSYSGVRPLAEDDARKSATSASRDYRIVSQSFSGNPLYSIFGGKITTYRALAEEVTDRICGTREGRWTARRPLPGAEIGPGGIEDFIERQKRRYPSLAPEQIARMARAYGTRMDVFLSPAASEGHESAALSPALPLPPGMSAAEILYLRDKEFARSAEDILWRRSKLGLFLSPDMAAQTAQAIDKILSEDNAVRP